MDSSSTTRGRPDHYALLGVGVDADEDAIRTAYRALAKQHHPDLADRETSRSTERFLEIQQAYDVLRDPDRRAQYDIERAREAQEERLLGWQRDFIGGHAQGAWRPAQFAAMAPPPMFAARRRVGPGLWLFVLLIAIAGVVSFIIGQQRPRHVAASSDNVTVVRVDDPKEQGHKQALSAELRALSREVDAVARRQAERTEVARQKAESQAAVASSAAPAPAERLAEESDGRVACSGEGRKFFVTRQGGINVSYNGGPAMRPEISEQGAGRMVVMSKVEPTNRISIAFIKGDKDGTIVLINDAAGNVYRTFAVECSAAVF
jgi:curved DNA-binding protein CbpA